MCVPWPEGCCCCWLQVLQALPSMEEFGRAHLASLDCTDRSVNLWDTLRPLAVSSMQGQGLDCIAP